MTTALTPAQIEILRRAQDGLPLWHGDAHVPRLVDEIALLSRFKLLARRRNGSYALTDSGRRWLRDNDDPAAPATRS